MAGSCEYGDESSGSGATELVTSLSMRFRSFTARKNLKIIEKAEREGNQH
jgi:hypothetical protein